jgi:hypothetical protein
VKDGALAGVVVALALATAGALRAQDPETPSGPLPPDVRVEAEPPDGLPGAQPPGAVAPLPLPTADELRELVAPAESVAIDPYRVKLESFRGDTISGVFLVDSDLPTARHVAFGRDAGGNRYVWFSRQNPLRASLVAIYDVDGRGLPDVLYWKQIDHEALLSRAREFRAPAAEGVVFEYASGRGCGTARCEEGWRDLPLERIEVPSRFLEPLGTLFREAAKHGEPHLDRPVASLDPGRAEKDPPRAPVVAVGGRPGD